eukprot:m.98572 g.98572  ORF g.98572 m.98572 type:complete len:174 (+) comp36991_c0_seq2:1473-1994(+)
MRRCTEGVIAGHVGFFRGRQVQLTLRRISSIGDQSLWNVFSTMLLIWRFIFGRPGGLANWCGYGVVPLASCLYEVGDEPAADSLSQCAKVTSPYEKTMWIDLEPKGRLLIQLGLNPTQVPFQFQTVERQDLKTKPKKRVQDIVSSTHRNTVLMLLLRSELSPVCKDRSAYCIV